MTGDGVGPNEMDAPLDFDDADANALISGDGRGIDARIADIVGDLSTAYASQPLTIGAELATLMSTDSSATVDTVKSPRRNRHMKAPLLVKIGVAAASLFAATGSLAVAHALPGPMQDAASNLGIGSPAHHIEHVAAVGSDATGAAPPETTTLPADTTPTSAEANDVREDPNTATEADDGNADSACPSRDSNTESQDHADATDTSTVQPTPEPTVPCAPDSPVTEPQTSDNRDANGDSVDDNTAVSTVPGPDDSTSDNTDVPDDNKTSVSTVPNGDDGRGETSVTTVPSSDNGGADNTSHHDGTDSANVVSSDTTTTQGD